jgi:hypothetical protein
VSISPCPPRNIEFTNWGSGGRSKNDGSGIVRPSLFASGKGPRHAVGDGLARCVVVDGDGGALSTMDVIEALTCAAAGMLVRCRKSTFRSLAALGAAQTALSFP